MTETFHHCLFCDKPADLPTWGGTRTFCDGGAGWTRRECGPDWAFTLGDDAGRRWGIRVIDEAVYGPSGLLFVDVLVDGHRVFKNPCPVDLVADGLPSIPWNLYTNHETLKSVIEGEDRGYEDDMDAYMASNRELNTMFGRIAVVLHEECLMRGIWGDVVTGYRKAQEEAHERMVATFKGRVMEQIEELRSEDGLSDEDVLQVFSDLTAEMCKQMGRPWRLSRRSP